MTTNNAVNSGLSGTTGTGSFVGSNSPSITTGINDTNGNNWIGQTANGSAVNYVNVTNNSSTNAPSVNAVGTDSNITLLLNGKGTGGAAVLGTSTNNNAAIGYVGEFVSSNIVAGSAVSLTMSATTYNITSISLTAGDWDIWGYIQTIPATGTTTGAYNFSISTTSATLGTVSPNIPYAFSSNIPANANQSFGLTTGVGRLSLSTTTTVYLVANVTFGVSTISAYGFIAARRVR